MDIDMVGKRFGRWVIVRGHGVCREGRVLCWARCDCGTERAVHLRNLIRGLSASCGCGKRGRAQKHGKCYLPENYIWRAMRQRCNNPSNGAYHRYGGRGIKVCERWDASFQAFYDDMGPRPTSGHEIERIDNDGPYSPENCRWATCKEQANNRRSNHIVTYFGKEMTLMEFGKECGLGWSTVRRRMVDFGMTPEEATARPLVGYR